MSDLPAKITPVRRAAVILAVRSGSINAPVFPVPMPGVGRAAGRCGRQVVARTSGSGRALPHAPRHPTRATSGVAKTARPDRAVPWSFS